MPRPKPKPIPRPKPKATAKKTKQGKSARPKPPPKKPSRQGPPTRAAKYVKPKTKAVRPTQAKQIEDVFSVPGKATGQKWFAMLRRGEISKTKLLFLLATGLGYVLRSRLGRQQLWALFSYLTGSGKWAALGQLATEFAANDGKPPPATVIEWGQEIAGSARNHMIGVKTGAPMATFIHDSAGKVSGAALSVVEAAVDYARYLSWTSQQNKLDVLVQTAVHATDDPLLVAALGIDVFSKEFVVSILRDPQWNPERIDDSISHEWRRRLMILWQLVLAQATTMQTTSKSHPSNREALQNLADHAQSLIEDLSKLA